MRKKLFDALMDFADDATMDNRLRLYHEIRQERIDAEPDEEIQLAAIADKLEEKPASGEYYF